MMNLLNKRLIARSGQHWGHSLLSLYSIFFVLMLIANPSHAKHLTLVDQEIDEGILEGPQDVVASPDGKHLYTGNTHGDTLSVFSVDNPTRTPVHITTYKKGRDDIERLAGITSMVFSPDGEYLYVTAYDDKATLIFSRDVEFGTLTLSGTVIIPPPHFEFSGQFLNTPVRDFDGALLAFTNPKPSHLTLSHDGRYAYITSHEYSGISIYERDSSTGSLTYLKSYYSLELKDQHPEIIDFDYDTPLAEPAKTIISDTGEHLYVVGHRGSLTVFDRNVISGDIALKENYYFIGVANPVNINGAIDVVFSNDQEHLYVLSSNATTVFGRNPDTGLLSLIQEIDTTTDGNLLGNGRSLTISSDGNHLYAIGTGGSPLQIFSRNPVTGALAQIQAFTEDLTNSHGLNGAYGQALSPDGETLYICAEQGDSVSTYHVDAESGLIDYVDSLDKQHIQASGMLRNADNVVMSPDGINLYVSGGEDQTINQYYFSPETGEMTLVATYRFAIPTGHMVISDDGHFIYMAGFYTGSIIVLERDIGTGHLSYISHIDSSYIEGKNDLYGARKLKLSPDNKHLYVLTDVVSHFNNIFSHSIITLARDAESGAISYVDTLPDGGFIPGGLYSPIEMAISSDGLDAYVLGSYTNRISHFKRDPETGRLTHVEYVRGDLMDADDLILSADENYIYVINTIVRDDLAEKFVRSWISVFHRNPVNGRMTYLRTHSGTDFSEPLEYLSEILSSRDGEFIYVSSGLSNEILIFTAQPDGSLRLVERVRDSDDEPLNLKGALGLALSPTDRHLFLTSTNSHSVSAFKIEETDSVTPSMLPTAPTIGTATAGNAGAIVAFIPGALGSGALVNYTAQCGSFTATGTSSPITVTGLTTGTTYTCKVKTTSRVGDSPWSALSNSVTPGTLITVMASDNTAAEAGLTTGRFTFTRTGSIAAALTVNYIVGGNATAGRDYASLGSRITFPIGASTVTRTVTPINDTRQEFKESVILSLSQSPNYAVGSARRATVIITSDETVTSTIIVAATDATATEAGRTTGRFTFTRTGSTAAALTVNYIVRGTATAGNDYVSLGSRITFPIGARTVTRIVKPINDTLQELNETVILTLSQSPNYAVGRASRATVTVTSND